MPGGVKASMKWLYTHVLSEPLDQCSATHWPALLYAVAFLHVTLTERSKLGPPAWNVPYVCTLTDFSNTVRCLQNHVDSLDRSKVKSVSMCLMISRRVGARILQRLNLVFVLFLSDIDLVGNITVYNLATMCDEIRKKV